MQPRPRAIASAAFLVGALTSLSGCIPVHVANDAFPVTRDEARADLDRMESEPKSLRRPVLLLAGYHDFSDVIHDLGKAIRRATSNNPEDFLVVIYPSLGEGEPIVDRIIEAVEAKWPSVSPDETVELDVIGHSMGGLAARMARLDPAELRFATRPFEDEEQEPEHRKRLRVARLFTLATPHRGAKLAERFSFDAMNADMRGGSRLIRSLDQDLIANPVAITAYGKLRDGIVGATRTSPPGIDPIWVSGTLMATHFNIVQDTRVIADIARRLRDETPMGQPSEPPHD